MSTHPSSLPKVSVIVPAYNAMRFLPATVDTVWQQTFTDFELLVIDDGSQDHIRDWSQTQTDPRFRLISQENRGLAGARNRGIEEARGELLAFLDADDLWHPTKLEQQVEALETDPKLGLAYTWTALMDAEEVKTGRVFKSDCRGSVWNALILNNFVGCGSVAMVRKSCFDSHGGFDQNLGSYVEDWDMWLRLALDYPFEVIEESLTYYRQLEGSASRNWVKMERSYQIVLDKAFAAAGASPDKVGLSEAQLDELRSRAYANTFLSLAWKPLQSKQKDIEAAVTLRRRAVESNPAVKRSSEFWRLTIAIRLMQLLGEQGYQNFLQWLYRIRRMAS